MKLGTMGIKVVASNKKAYHDFFIEETFEAGLMLQGTEVKSLRLSAVNLRESYCRIKNGEVFVENMHISPYEFGNIENHEPLRRRKLLLHAEEIRKLTKKVEEKGLSLIPTKLYFKGGRAKLEIGTARGKKMHDKRQSLKEKQDDREIHRIMRNQQHD